MTLAAPLLLLLAALGAAAPVMGATSCTTCHADPAKVGADKASIVKKFEADVHAAVGLSCDDCHGGNAAPEVSGDARAAKDVNWRERPYIGKPERAAIPRFCGRCHSSPDYMKRFRPDARIDQEREYWTSRHGELLRQGDRNVATCIDCHGTHGILRPSEPQSAVYPTHVAETCRGCHADVTRMAGYTLADGRPIPVDQYERWARSVHALALLDKEDLSAPTCNDCHGNHGAAPPGLDSVAFVCGQCHGREAELFRDSPKHAGFEEHNELLETVDSAEEKPCLACHESEPAGQVTSVRRFSECITCHGNHAVLRPTVAMLGPLPETPCQFCHQATGAVEEAQNERYERARDDLLAVARQRGLEGDARFDWLVQQAQTLPQHTDAAADALASGAAMKPEFQLLFAKFRIGMTHFSYRDPVSGETVTDGIIRCTNCHPATASAKDGEAEPGSSAVFLQRMRALTTNIARTERMLLRARRGGVAVGNAAANLDHAVDAQIQLEVLVHRFSTDDGSAFATAAAEGMKQVQEAHRLALAALEELEFRRRGLAASLVVVLLVLIALGLKIRELARRGAAAPPPEDS
jgi:hypothetical protein